MTGSHDDDIDGRRRDVVLGALALAAVGGVATPGTSTAAEGHAMYGLIGRMSAQPRQRDALARVLLDAMGDLPGCLSYIVATDPADADALWITEVWDRKESHDTSLALPAVQAAIAKGRPMIAAFGTPTVTTPIGGQGLPG